MGLMQLVDDLIPLPESGSVAQPQPRKLSEEGPRIAVQTILVSEIVVQIVIRCTDHAEHDRILYQYEYH
jgi:hypothetical protein